jgi:dihydroceramidase
MQLVDELSMIYTTCIMFYASFSYQRSSLYSIILSTALFSLSLFITVYYHYLQDPVFHQIAYALLTATVVFRSMFVMEMGLRPSLRTKEAELALLKDVKSGTAVNGNGVSDASEGMSMAQIKEVRRREARDEDILRTMWMMISYGLSVFLGGFAVWGLDRVYCSQLRRWRQEVGLPWGIVLEGHGWW